jgi:hypothetical protein
LTQVRKFKTRVITAFQGVQPFPDRGDDRLLNALIGQCNLQFYFRHKNPVDAKFFGAIVKLPSIDLLKKKHVLTTPQQYQDGNELVVLTDETANWSDADQQGASQSDAVSDTQTHTNSANQSTAATDTRSESIQRLADAVSRAHSNQTGSGSSDAVAHGTTRSDARNWSNTHTRGGGITRKTTLVPRIRTRDVVTSIQFYTADEQIIQAASDLTQYAIGTALLYIGGHGIAEVKLPLAGNPLRQTPQFAAKKLAELRKLVLVRGEFATPEQLFDQRRDFERQLVQYLNERQMNGQAPPQLGYTEPPDDNPLLNI